MWNLDHGPVDPGSMHERGDGPARDRVADEPVTIKALALDRDEQVSGPDGA
jgi:hypothetical protein